MRFLHAVLKPRQSREGRMHCCRGTRRAHRWTLFAFALPLAVLPLAATAAVAPPGVLPELFGIPVDFLIFATILLGVALFHHHTLAVALTGLTALIAYKLAFMNYNFLESGR
jgi:hypothetical protein